MEDFSKFLRETDLFHNLDDEQAHKIAELFQIHKFKQGDIVFSENSKETELYIIIQGEVNILVNPDLVSKSTDDKTSPEIIATLRRGQSFGEMSLSDEGLRSASAVINSSMASLLVIPRVALLDLCNSDPSLGYKVMFNLCNDLSQKIRFANLQIRDAILKQKAGN